MVRDYLLTDIKDRVLIRLTGKTMEVTCEINTTYKSFLALENGKRIFNLKLKKALYGCI